MGALMNFFLFAAFLFPAFCAFADTAKGHLTPLQVERLRTVKQMLAEVDDKSLRQTIDEMEKAGQPQVNLAIREAIAATYSEIVQEKNVVDQGKKAWLYSMVTLNMAYLQFGATKESGSSSDPLNRIIRRKLKEHLPAGIVNHPGFHISLE